LAAKLINKNEFANFCGIFYEKLSLFGDFLEIWLVFGAFEAGFGRWICAKCLRSKIFLVATDNCTGFSVLFAYF
jgi:hypothetical protein